MKSRQIDRSKKGGTVLKAGDFVMYEPGTFHNSRTEKKLPAVGD